MRVVSHDDVMVPADREVTSILFVQKWSNMGVIPTDSQIHGKHGIHLWIHEQDRCVWLIWLCTPHHAFLIKVSLFPDMLGLFPTFGETKPVVTQQCLSGAPFQYCVSTTALDSRLPNTFSKADVFPGVWKPRAVFPDTCWTWCGRLNSCFCRWFEITNREEEDVIETLSMFDLLSSILFWRRRSYRSCESGFASKWRV